MVELSYLHMTTGKTIALTTQTFVGKVMSLLFTPVTIVVIQINGQSRSLLVSVMTASK